MNFLRDVSKRVTDLVSKQPEKIRLDVFSMEDEGDGKFFASSEDGRFSATLSGNGKIRIFGCPFHDSISQPVLWILKNYNNGLIDYVDIDLTDFGINSPYTCKVNENSLFVSGSYAKYKVMLVFPLVEDWATSKHTAIVAYEIADFITFDKKSVLFVKKFSNYVIINIYRYDEETKRLVPQIRDARLDFPFKANCEEIAIDENKNDFRIMVRFKTNSRDFMLLKTFETSTDVAKFDKLVSLNYKLKEELNEEEEENDEILKTIWNGNYIYFLTKGHFCCSLFRVSLESSSIELIHSIYDDDNETNADPVTIRVLEHLIGYVWNRNLKIFDLLNKKVLLSSYANEICHLGKQTDKNGKFVYQALILGSVTNLTELY